MHLLVDGPFMRLRLFHIRNPGGRQWQEVTADLANTFTTANPDVVVVTPIGRFLPQGPGTTTVRIERPAGGGLTLLRGIVRVSVHNAIDRIWAGNNQVTIRNGASDYILSVYARFTDGTIADISGHPYLSYTVNSTALSVDPDGRVNGRNLVLREPVEIGVQGVSGTVAPVEVEVTVIDPAQDLIPNLVPIHGSATLTDRRNILLVTEGFNGSEMTAFRTNVINLLVRRLFGSRSHSPFRILRDSLNVWALLQPSAERGITVGPSIEIIRSAAKPFVPAAGATTLPGEVFPLQARDSFFGLMYGARVGDSEARLWTTGPPAGDPAEWIQPPRAARSITVDPRHLPDLQIDPAVSFRTRLDQLFDSLGSDAAHWKTNQRDAGLVAFLVNDDIHGGSVLIDDTTVAATIGHGDFFLDSLNNPPLHPGRDFWDHEPRLSSTQPIVEAVAAKVSHELGHSPVFVLGDEYEDGATAINQNLARIERFRNLHMNVPGTHGNPPTVNVTRIKWNRHRIIKAGLMRATPTDQPPNRIFVPLRIGTPNVWVIGDQVFFSNPNSGALTPPLEFAGYDRTTEEVFLITTGGLTTADYNLAAFALGSFMYTPLHDAAGTIRTLIDPDVLADLAANGAFGQLTVDQCTGVAAPPPENPAGDPTGRRSPRIRPAGMSFWLPDHEVIGYYEGGGIFRCRVYRPTGHCRMRHHYDYRTSTHVEFCFVCKYRIVEAIDPSRHPALEAEYPE
jgi:hypothetical protein